LAARLVREEVRSSRNRDEARMLVLVNGMVIESLTDGVLVVDQQHIVRVANPAAHRMIGSPQLVAPQTFNLNDDPAWRELALLANLTFASGPRGPAEITLTLPGGRSSHLRARTERTVVQSMASTGLCVLFLQDLREIEAQVRTEKLAAMGRMSAAVAHEIRNPLAAIAQANALLTEDLADPALQRLTTIVRQNAERLGHIVDDILDVARVSSPSAVDEAQAVPLDDLVAETCHDWSHQHAAGARLALTQHLPSGQTQQSPGGQAQQSPGRLVQFASGHLRRIVVNLLDNAARYASQRNGAIQVETQTDDSLRTLRIWSDGAPLELSVQRHLFEPFFSSESRSSGLGLYICRELCERHGAAITYERVTRPCDGETREGNAFCVTFRLAPPAMDGQRPLALFDTPTVNAQNANPA
jgi:two-component system sensor histidine kinase PilS (NtrC family)